MGTGSAIGKIVEQHMLEWMMMPGVMGAAEGIHRGKPCILILVEKKTQERAKAFPERIGGVRLVLKEVGRAGKK